MMAKIMTMITTIITTTTMAEPEAPPIAFWRNPRWWRAWAVAGFGPMFLIFCVLAIVSGTLVWYLKGPDIFWQALQEDLAMVWQTVPRVVVAVGAASILWVLMPREKLSALVGRNAGVRGLIFASMAGAVTPGGPTSAFALLAMLGAVGADRGTLVAYISAWATLGLQRILIWDMPMMGFDFSALRFAATLPLPVCAGLLARALPITLNLKEERRLRDKL